MHSYMRQLLQRVPTCHQNTCHLEWLQSSLSCTWTGKLTLVQNQPVLCAEPQQLTVLSTAPKVQQGETTSHVHYVAGQILALAEDPSPSSLVSKEASPHDELALQFTADHSQFVMLSSVGK